MRIDGDAMRRALPGTAVIDAVADGGTIESERPG